MAEQDECRCDVATIHGDALETLVSAVMDRKTTLVAHNAEHAHRVMVLAQTVAERLG